MPSLRLDFCHTTAVSDPWEIGHCSLLLYMEQCIFFKMASVTMMCFKQGVGRSGQAYSVLGAQLAAIFSPQVVNANLSF